MPWNPSDFTPLPEDDLVPDAGSFAADAWTVAATASDWPTGGLEGDQPEESWEIDGYWWTLDSNTIAAGDGDDFDWFAALTISPVTLGAPLEDFSAGFGNPWPPAPPPAPHALHQTLDDDEVIVAPADDFTSGWNVDGYRTELEEDEVAAAAIDPFMPASPPVVFVVSDVAQWFVVIADGSPDFDLTIPYMLTSSDTLPSGLSLNRQYWAVEMDTGIYRLALSEGGLGQQGVVKINDEGYGAHTATPLKSQFWTQIFE